MTSVSASLADIAPALRLERERLNGNGLYPLLTVPELLAMPPRRWILEGLVAERGFDVLFGPSGSGKSFLALDWALCIASGLSWYGKTSTPGWVLYVAAEGLAGLSPRVKAWQEARDFSNLERIRFMADAPNLLQGGDVDRLRRTVASMPEPPLLIVVDTMARTMVGGDENAARDVGQFIAGVDNVRRDVGATALVIHHTGKNGEDERGSSALRGAADLMHSLKPDGAGIRLECVKAKDWAPEDSWQLHLSEVAESCVLRVGTQPGQMAPSEVQLLRESHDAFGTAWASATALKEASTLTKTSFYRSAKQLAERGFFEKEELGRGVRYRVTEDGVAELVPASPTESHETVDRVPSHLSLYGTVGLERETDGTGGLFNG